MKYACIQRHEGLFPIVLMCRVLTVSRPGYYAWRGRRPSARAQADTHLRIAIRAIHAASRERYGRPRIHRALQAQAVACSPKRVARLMRLDGLRGKRSRRYRATTQADPTPPAPNHLRRCFRVPALNRVWVSDVTACPTQPAGSTSRSSWSSRRGGWLGGRRGGPSARSSRCPPCAKR